MDDLKKFLNKLNELHSTTIGAEYGKLRKSNIQVRPSIKGKLPPGTSFKKPWKFSGKWYSDSEADNYLRDKLIGARVEEKEIETMDIDEKINRLKKMKIGF